MNDSTTTLLASIVDGSVTEIENSDVLTIGDYAFADCSVLATASFPAATTISGSAFQNCSALTTVSFPNVTTINTYAFYNCTSLTTASFPSATTIGNSAFRSCSALSAVSFPNITSIGSNAFYECGNLAELNLVGVKSVPLLKNINAFDRTPISNYTLPDGGKGSVYVPASLYSDFLAATNWSRISSVIVSIGE